MLTYTKKSAPRCSPTKAPILFKSPGKSVKIISSMPTPKNTHAGIRAIFSRRKAKSVKNTIIPPETMRMTSSGVIYIILDFI